jgi:hypothetical protein
MYGNSDIGSPLYFNLLRQWLQTCDERHPCNRSTQFWPARVIFVGHPDPIKLELWETKLGLRERLLKFRKAKRRGDLLRNGDGYITLSHCWGTPTDDEKKQFCTTRETYKCRLKGFSMNDLPKTFQDAVRVTRELGKQFLWIDSLCIIQNDERDWNVEAKRMEDIFSSSYCTIAASSAKSGKEGFLNRKSIRYVQVQDFSGMGIYVCNDIDDFDRDVEKGPLNQRAWVLQERVLSSRIIHFTSNLTYWECGDGVRCENFARMLCSPGRQNYVLDPSFPDRLLTSGYDRTVDFIQFLSKKYAQNALTNPSDREVAISGLIKRIERASSTEGSYGIFSRFLSRLLLWQRSDNNTADEAYEDQQLPSWSWMRYSGIDFLATPRLMVPPPAELRFDAKRKDALLVQIRDFEDCEFQIQETECTVIHKESREKAGTLWFDIVLGIHFQYCVVIGMANGEIDNNDHPNTTYYILVVRGKSSENEYERVGIGKIEARCVSRVFRKVKLT